MGLVASSKIRMRLQVLATAITYKSKINKQKDEPNLPSSALSVLGSLNDTRHIEQLDFSAFVLNHPRNASKSGKFIVRNFAESSG